MKSVAQSTIAALSTPPGAGGIAIIRLSGPEAHTIVRRVFHPWPENPENDLPLKILANGDLTKALKVKAAKFSKAAKEKIESAGGSCETL